MTRTNASLMLLCAAFFWGAGNVANKTVLKNLDPMTVVCLRTMIAALVMVPFALRERGGAPGWWKGALFTGLLFTGAMVLQQMAYQDTTVTNASFLVNTASILTPLIGWLVLRHRPAPQVLVAAFVTLAGAFLMAGQVSLAHLNRGDIACLASAVFYAGWMVALSAHAARHHRPFGTCLVQFLVTAFVLSPVMLRMQPTLGSVRAALPELLILGLFSTAAAFLLQTWGQRYVAAPVAAVLVSAESIFGAFAAWLLLNEQTPASGLTGAALILIAIAIAASAAERTITPGAVRISSTEPESVCVKEA